ELVGLRVEDPAVFAATHTRLLAWCAAGVLDGLRIDHIDGLADPAGYCHKLRQRLDPNNPSGPYLVVEKILLRGETLPADWGCDGTTGYDFMDEVSALQHDPQAEAVLAEAWSRQTGRPADFATEEAAARREIIARSFSAQLEACVAAFDRLEQSDLNRPALRRALTEILVHFPVYRGYGTPADVPWLERAATAAKQTGLAGDDWVIDWLQRRMLERHRATTRFQQLSAPIAAKAVEDTAFYRYRALLSRNDVGFDTERFGWSAADFHARMQRRLTEQPNALLATATHDHKRGEDVRARLAVLSENPHAWTERLARWIAEAEPLRTSGMPDRADTAMLLQMITGAWPLDLALEDAVGRAAFARRLEGWQQKALREAKLATDWSDPNVPYETAARDLLHRLVVEDRAPALLADIFAFIQEIAPAGTLNSLAQTLLRLTVPGVPDLYQGTELWDFSLVDPDNRRPVDFTLRQKLLGTATWRDGAVKQALIVQALGLRKAMPDLFAKGSYEPLTAQGPLANHVVAFLRRHELDALAVVVPRLPTGLTVEGLADTSVALPARLELFSTLEEDVVIDPHAALQQLWRRWPVALLSTQRLSTPFPKQELPRK
ncbi:MAG TPA: malto-oligosyltrehalose synthase, partial [Acetobacteraceae bacterium]|nr:malto-oligosyltrehalose synthase [Acetobacteraceae bacterium]